MMQAAVTSQACPARLDGQPAQARMLRETNARIHRRVTLLAAGSAVAAPAQAPGFYRFRVDAFTVTTVHDGFVARPLVGFVRNAPLAEVQAAPPPLSRRPTAPSFPSPSPSSAAAIRSQCSTPAMA
jgi:hypothetical protein